jgi:peptidoglycan/xylan/chitin deacetylase (PgdA/CDA1 family)
VVALTFDDGPHPQFTPRILDILQRYGVRATFFELGMNAERYPDLTRRIVAEGHIVGNHTWDHKHLTKLTDEQFDAEIDRTTQVLEQISGHEVVCTRPPYGDADARIVQKLADHGQASVVWSTDSRDFEKPGADAIVHNALAGLRPGAIILMHDAGGNRDETIAALPRIIEGIRAKGYRIEPVCDRRDHRPTGSVERVGSDAPERLQASGWTVDPDTNEPTEVHLYVDGTFAAKAVADRARPDVGAARGAGDAHGFAFDIPAQPGSHHVCVFAINAGLGDTNMEIGCKDIAVAEIPWLDRFGRELHLLPDDGRWEDLPAAPPVSQALRGLYDSLLPST